MPIAWISINWNVIFQAYFNASTMEQCGDIAVNDFRDMYPRYPEIEVRWNNKLSTAELSAIASMTYYSPSELFSVRVRKHDSIFKE